jgi:hypothetical protein
VSPLTGVVQILGLQPIFGLPGALLAALTALLTAAGVGALLAVGRRPHGNAR